MTAYRPIDSKREEFRKYLERCGVMDALTRVLVMLYEEPDKPEDALEFVRAHLGDSRPSALEVEAMKADLEEALKRITILENENCELKKKLYGEDDTEHELTKVNSDLLDQDSKKTIKDDQTKETAD